MIPQNSSQRERKDLGELETRDGEKLDVHSALLESRAATCACAASKESLPRSPPRQLRGYNPWVSLRRHEPHHRARQPEVLSQMVEVQRVDARLTSRKIAQRHPGSSKFQHRAFFGLKLCREAPLTNVHVALGACLAIPHDGDQAARQPLREAHDQNDRYKDRDRADGREQPF